MANIIDDSIMKDFFDEAFSQIEIIEENLLILEKNKNDKNAIDTIFRAAHTLKGGSATVQMTEIMEFTHLLEDVMDEIRNGKIKMTTAIVDALLASLDLIKNMVNARSNGSIYKKNYSSIEKKLKDIINKSGDSAAETENSAKTKETGQKKTDKTNEITENEKFRISEYDLLEINEVNTENLPLYKIIVRLDESNPMRTVGGIQIFTSLREIGLVIRTVPDFEEIYSDIFHKEIMYILASKVSEEKIREFTTIPDTTEKVIIMPLSHDNIMDFKSDKADNSKKKVKIIEKEDSSESNQGNDSSEEGQEEEESSSDAADLQQAENTKIEQKGNSSSILRVDSNKIDILLNLVSEIVINKATFTQIFNKFIENYEAFNYTINRFKDDYKQIQEKFFQFIDTEISNDTATDFKTKLQTEMQSLLRFFDPISSNYKSIINLYKSNSLNLDRISSSLQESVMRVRMVPVKQIFSRFPRMVRDLSKNLKKEIDLVIIGEETEIDKGMIDFLMDPLIHIVRNAIDHGIESPQERKLNGKSTAGRLELSAVSEGNIICINVTDDGRGLDLEKIQKKAIEKKFIDPDVRLSSQDAYNLLFEPSFSTADEVTAVSGRGVGLDVVKKNIEKLNGSIRINSELGMGSTFSLKIPLTLAIIQGLLVEVHKQIYAIPISSVIESIRIKTDEIKTVENYEVVNVRDEVLSLLRLNRLFKLPDKENVLYYYVIIVGTNKKKIGLLVDAVIGEEDVVIKPLRDKYTSTPGIAGATILGDGSVSLILDTSQLIELGIKTDIEQNKMK